MFSLLRLFILSETRDRKSVSPNISYLILLPDYVTPSNCKPSSLFIHSFLSFYLRPPLPFSIWCLYTWHPRLPLYRAWLRDRRIWRLAMAQLNMQPRMPEGVYTDFTCRAIIPLRPKKELYLRVDLALLICATSPYIPLCQKCKGRA